MRILTCRFPKNLLNRLDIVRPIFCAFYPIYCRFAVLKNEQVYGYLKYISCSFDGSVLNEKLDFIYFCHVNFDRNTTDRKL